MLQQPPPPAHSQPSPLSLSWSHQLLESTPVFTDPSTDFELHSQQLLQLVQEVYRLKDRFFLDNYPNEFTHHSLLDASPRRKQQLAAQQAEYLLALIGKVIARLNILTKPPVRKKKKRSAAVVEEGLAGEEKSVGVVGGGEAAGVVSPLESNSPSKNESFPPSSGDVLNGKATSKNDTNANNNNPTHINTNPLDTIVSDHTFDFTLSNAQKAFYYYLRGHLYNALPYPNDTAEENLSKAIKLDPSLVCAWNSIGELYWKKGDLLTARHCFEGAIAQERNKESLRKLSMVYRQWPAQDMAQRRTYIESSLALCKEAVGMDLNDGISWMILGNAYLNRFFNVTHDAKDIKMALSAYNHSESDPVAAIHPDIYHNRAIINDYMEDYQTAYGNFLRALQLDPTTTGNEEKLMEIVSYCKKMMEAITRKGFVKNKRLQAEIPTIAVGSENDTNDTLDALIVNQVNTGAQLRCKVLAPVNAGSKLKRSYVAVDRNGTVFALTIYKLGQPPSSGSGGGGTGEVLKPFDELLLSDPEYLSVHLDVEQAGTAVEYPSVRVMEPWSAVLNGKPFPRSAIAPIYMTLIPSV